MRILVLSATFALALIIHTLGFAQRGLYLTGDDLSSDKLSFAQSDVQKYRIRLNDFIYRPFIQVSSDDTTYRLAKDSIFGFRDGFGDVYRFYSKGNYKVLNQGERMLLYSRQFKANTKGFVLITRYFFSRDAYSPILPLTKLNLKKAYPDNGEWHELLDMYFKSDQDLLDYDTFYNTYKINRIQQLLMH